MTHKEYRPTLAQLRTFVTIAENKHFGTAANKLGISQPSLSQALVALENGLGVQLIERSTRKVIITPIGEVLLPHAKATLEAAEQFMTNARGEGGHGSGSLSIGIIPTVAPYLLPTLLERMPERSFTSTPHIIEDQTRHLIVDLREGNIDCALVALPLGITGISEIELYEEDFLLIVPEGHPLAGRDDLTLSELRSLNLELLLLDDGHCLRDQVINLCHQSDITLGGPGEITTRASSLATVIQCVAGGLGATLIPASAVPTECGRPGIATARFTPEVTASRKMALAYRSSSSRLAEFNQLADLIRDCFAEVIEPVTKKH